MSRYLRQPRVFWLLGLAALVAGGLAALKGAGPAPADSPALEAPGVVCFGHVDVEHGVASLAPVQPGRVVEVLVAENEPVRAGAAVLRLDDDRAKLRVQEAAAALRAAQARLARMRTLPQQHQLQVDQLRAVIDALGQRASAARHVSGQKRELFDLKLVGRAERDAAEDHVRELDASLRGEQARLAELELRDPTLDVRGAEEEVAAREASWRQAEQDVKDCVLRAPTDGRVLRRLVGPGDLVGVAPKPAAVLFCPDGPRLVRAEVEQEYASQVQVGQRATVQDDSGAAGQWTGRVTRLSDWYTRRRSTLDEPLQLNDVRTLECLIELDVGQAPLRIGQRVRVTIGAY